MQAPFDPGSERYINLATFRRNGDAVRTPVWVAEQDARLFVFSEARAGKVKRLRNSTAAQIAPCDMRGKLLGEWWDVTARVVTDEVNPVDIYAAFTSKYGMQMRIADFFAKLSGRYDRRAIIEITLPVE